MSVNYSFKHHFNWPLPSTATAPIAPAAAPFAPGPMPYNHYGYGGGRFFRPKFGIFRRVLWFSLGWGAASWYINKKHQEHLRMIAQGDIDAPPAADATRKWGWREWHAHHHRQVAPIPSVPVASGNAAIHPSAAATPSASTPNSPSPQASTSTDELAVLRSTIDSLMREKAAEMGELQVKAKTEAREYAREKLEKLSTLLEGLKETLSKDSDQKGKKLV